VDEPNASGPALRRDLGTLESYAVLVGILIGAGIFKVTSDATVATGPSVILAHLVLAPVVLATSVAYLVFLSTSLGLEPGGEILHIDRTFGSRRLTFLAAWLKLVSYLGAGAYLADALARNLLELGAPGKVHGAVATRLLALVLLFFFFWVHVAGVRWFGRFQVAMCAVLAVSLAILILPGLFAVDASNYRPFFTHGAGGFCAALPPMFFAYAGFEALAQAAGEVRDSRARLPRVFVLGILSTSGIFLAMTVVALGVLRADDLGATDVPMSRAASTYLPFGATAVVTLGAVMAVATSLNVTMLVPARLAWHLAREGHVPRVFARLNATARTPVVGSSVSFGIVAALLVSGRMDLALGIAVVALMILYALHSVALILLPRRNLALCLEATSRIPRGLQLAAAWTSVLAMGSIVAIQFGGDVRRILGTSFARRLEAFDLTSLESLLAWVAVGLVLFRWRDRTPLP
jgi:amino acid transporter